MFKYPLRRSYTTGWYTLSERDAVKGLTASLSKRKGVENIFVDSCYPAQLSGDKGYKMHVSYEEDLDKTFGFPENLDKVIFLDVDSSILPYFVQKLALETQAGIVIVTPSLKDEYYDVGEIFPLKLADLMERSSSDGVQIVGITPSIGNMKHSDRTYSDMLEYSIHSYLLEHPSIKNFIIVSKEDLQAYSSNLIKYDDIPYDYLEKAKNILNGEQLPKEKTKRL